VKTGGYGASVALDSRQVGRQAGRQADRQAGRRVVRLQGTSGCAAGSASRSCVCMGDFPGYLEPMRRNRGRGWARQGRTGRDTVHH